MEENYDFINLDTIGDGINGMGMFDFLTTWCVTRIRQGKSRDVVYLSAAKVVLRQQQDKDVQATYGKKSLDEVLDFVATLLTVPRDLHVSTSVRQFRDKLEEMYVHIKSPEIHRALQSVMDMLAKVFLDVAKVIGAVGRLICILLDHEIFLDLAAKAFLMIASFFPDMRARGKSVWIPLFRHSRLEFNELDLLLMRAPLMKAPEPLDVQAALKQTRDLINRFLPIEQQLKDDGPTFTRTIEATAGKVHYAAAQLATELKRLDVNAAVPVRMDSFYTAVATKWLEQGADLGIDQAILATEAKMDDSLGRYLLEPIGMKPEDKSLAQDCITAQIEHVPDIAIQPRLTGMKSILHKLDPAFSAGIPIMKEMKTRREMITNGVMAAVIKAAEWCIENGVYPNQLYHAFPKSQVIRLEKAMTKMRTVIAQDLLTKFVDDFFQFERNKRSVSDVAGTGAGLRLTEKPLLAMFEAVYESEQAVEGDFTEFDANNPELGKFFIAELARQGAAGQPWSPQFVAAQEARLAALNQAHIFSLPTSTIKSKRRGGATGQSATTWDNTWSVRPLFMFVWCKITGKEPSQFYHENVVYNTADDNLWGCNTPGFDFSKVTEYFEQELGMKLTISAGGPDHALTYLGRQRVELNERQILEASEAITEDHGPYGIIFVPARLTFKRTAFVSRSASRPHRERLQGFIETTQGHATLVAHQPELYDMLAQDWAAAHRRLLRQNGGIPEWAIITDVKLGLDGYIRDVDVRVVDQFADNHMAQYLRAKRYRMPSYRRVLQIHCGGTSDTTLDTVDPTTGYKYNKKVRKALAISQTGSTFVGELVANLATYREIMFHYGRPFIKHLTPDIQNPVYRPVRGSSFLVERHLYLTNDEDANVISAQAIVSPFAATVDVWAFRAAISNPHGFMKVFGSERPKDYMNASIIKVGLAQLLVWLISLFLENLRFIPILGLFAQGYLFWIFDLPMFYGLLSAPVWLFTGKSSPLLSSMIPKDTLMHHKQLAINMVSLIPDDSVNWIPIQHLKGFIVNCGDWAGAAMAAWNNASEGQHRTVSKATEWEALMEAQVIEEPSAVTIESGTATGKSSRAMAALAWALRKHRPGSRIRFATPFKHLAKGFHFGGAAPNDWFSIGTGTKEWDRNRTVLVGTAGHHLATLRNDPLREGDILVIDEAHLEMDTQVLLMMEVPAFVTVIFLSATPTMPLLEQLRPSRLISSGLPDRFEKVVEITPTDDALEMLNYIASSDEPDRQRVYENCLVVVPTKGDVLRLTTRLSESGYKTQPWWSGLETPSAPGLIISTSIAIVGTDLPFPLLHIITPGKIMSVQHGRPQIVTMDKDTTTQCVGRVGRKGRGYAWRGHKEYGPKIPPSPPNVEVIINHRHRERLLQLYGLTLDVTLSRGPGVVHGMPWARLSDRALQFTTDVRVSYLLARAVHYCPSASSLRAVLAYVVEDEPTPESQREIVKWIRGDMTIRDILPFVTTEIIMMWSTFQCIKVTYRASGNESEGRRIGTQPGCVTLL
jgi:hypothetical protein